MKNEDLWINVPTLTSSCTLDDGRVIQITNPIMELTDDFRTGLWEFWKKQCEEERLTGIKPVAAQPK